MSAPGIYSRSQYPHSNFASAPLAGLAGKHDVVRRVLRTVLLITAAVAILAPVAGTTAAAASASPAPSTAQSGTAAAGVIATITVGGEPLAVAVNPVTNTIYVTNTANGSVSVINGQTNTVTATITPRRAASPRSGSGSTGGPTPSTWPMGPITP